MADRPPPPSSSCPAPGTGGTTTGVRRLGLCLAAGGSTLPVDVSKGSSVGSVIKKRRKRMAKKKHRKLLKKTRVQRRRLGK